MRPLPASVSKLALRIDRRLTQLLKAEEARWTKVDPDLAVPLSTLRSYALSGGKRLRPALCYWAFVGAGGDAKDPAVIDAGAALEMLHTAALIHDDVIDGSARRHGADAVQIQYAARHAENFWSGRSDRFGEGMAILLGDLALVYSEGLMAGAPASALGVFQDLRLEVNVGQYLDVLGAAQGFAGDISAVDRARRICRYKTAKYTVERPLHLGAALVGPARLVELAKPLTAFGLPLGEAFQLRDDLLGVFGDPHVTGKPVGDDLREGKLTLLAALAAAAARGADAELFRDRFGAPDLTDAEVTALQDLIQSTGARAEVEETILSLLEAATSALRSLPLTAPAVTALGEIAAFIAGRDH